ncbi:MAG: methionine--tRNA ligase subunit beta, partial [Bacteroidota bacterium]|nr:methionine--tRNA ligase subunit beta [Bacteroidota bacterium]
FTSKKLGAMININKDLKWNDATRTDLLLAGHQINPSGLLFEKIEDETVDEQVLKLKNSKMINEAESHKAEIILNDENAGIPIINPAKADISFDDFNKMDIRVGTILEAERVPKTDKLMKLLIDTGIDQRIVVSGIAAYYKPEDIIGQKVSILVNLAPRKIKNIESQGMILMAENSNGELSFVVPGKSGVDNGANIK